MANRWRATAGIASVLCVAAVVRSQPHRQAPKKPDRTFSVFVFTEGLKNEEVDMPDVAAEVAKRIDKKKWLKHVEARESADIVVEVLKHSVNERYRTQLSNRVDYQGTGKSWIDENFVTEWHRIEARVDFTTGQRLLTGLDERPRGGSVKGAASDLADQLEDYCKEHYWDLIGFD